MPGYIIHLAVAKEYIKNNNDIKNIDSFLNGIIMPDMLQKPESHYGYSTSKPDLNFYVESHSMNDDFNKGYFLHLITDYLFYNKYFANFDWTPEIYDDYDRLNKILIEKYKIKIPEKISNIVQFKDGELKVLDLDSLCRFIKNIGRINIEQLLQNREFDSVFDKVEEDYEK